MPTLLSFTFYGEAQLERTLERYEAAGDMTEAWEAIADDFARIERRQFATEGRYASGGWSPLSPRYAQWKARHYPGKPILEREGDLMTSLTQRPFGIEVITPTDLWMGSDVDYGRHHQRGSGRLPRRRPVELTETDRRRWVKIVQTFLRNGTVTVGPRGGIR